MAGHQIQVMGDQQDGDVVGVAEVRHQLVEQGQARPVHPGDWLIQQEDVRHRMDGQCQQHPLDLAAGKVADTAVCQGRHLGDRQHLLHQGQILLPPGKPHRPAGKACQYQVADGDGAVGVHRQLLGNIAEPWGGGAGTAVFHEVNFSRVGNLPQQGPEEGGLAGTVPPDDGSELPAVDVEIHLVQDGASPCLHRKILDSGAAHVVGRLAGMALLAAGAVGVLADVAVGGFPSHLAVGSVLGE